MSSLTMGGLGATYTLEDDGPCFRAIASEAALFARFQATARGTPEREEAKTRWARASSSLETCKRSQAHLDWADSPPELFTSPIRPNTPEEQAGLTAVYERRPDLLAPRSSGLSAHEQAARIRAAQRATAASRRRVLTAPTPAPMTEREQVALVLQSQQGAGISPAVKVALAGVAVVVVLGSLAAIFKR